MAFFSLDEKQQLTESTFIVALVFTIAYVRGIPGFGIISHQEVLARIFGVSLVCAGLGFFLHESAHKLVAQHFGMNAVYQANKSSNLISILAAFAGWIILSPGAVHVWGRDLKDKRYMGLIGLSGPITNLLLALAFMFSSDFPYPLSGTISAFGMHINLMLFAFNMIPAPGFDGKKVFDWDKVVYLLFAFVAFIAVFVL